MKILALLAFIFPIAHAPVQHIHVQIPTISYTPTLEVQGCETYQVTTSSEVYLETSGGVGGDGDNERFQRCEESKVHRETTND